MTGPILIYIQAIFQGGNDEEILATRRHGGCCAGFGGIAFDAHFSGENHGMRRFFIQSKTRLNEIVVQAGFR